MVGFSTEFIRALAEEVNAMVEREELTKQLGIEPVIKREKCSHCDGKGYTEEKEYPPLDELRKRRSAGL